MLVAISGSQGSGKSSTLKAIEDRGYNVIDRKTSRSILTERSQSLDDIKMHAHTFADFQMNVLNRKRDDEEAAVESTGVWFTERSYADLFTYALITLGQYNGMGAWIDRYYRLCLEYNQLYSKVFYLKAGAFMVESDGVRGSNTKYSRLVDVTMQDVTTQMIHPSKLSIITTPELDVRADIILRHSMAHIW